MGKTAFNFNVLELGEDPWIDRAKRLGRERELINQYQLYNTIISKLTALNSISTNTTQPVQENSKSAQPNSIPVVVYGTRYESISVAAKQSNASLPTARRLLNDYSNNDWVYEDQSKRQASNVARPVVAANNVFASVSLAAAHYGLSGKTIRKFINSKPNWDYLDLLDEKQQAVFKQQLNMSGSFKMGRKVKVGQTVFSSIQKAAAHYDINSRSVRKRIESKNFPEWQWEEEHKV